jgi:NADH:ubiquinone oxidoreductase subunit 4 (subunit M)
MNFFPFVYTISVLTILYSNLSVFTQVDIKKTIAYYSIGHMGFVTLGLCTGSNEGFTGAITIMVAHGLSAAGLFFLVGYLYEKTHTRALFAYRGVATTAPIFAFFMFIFICANMGLPGTINFAGEQLVLASLIKYHFAAALLPLVGVLLNGISSILFINRLLFGEVNPLVASTVSDVRTSEFVVFGAVGFPLVFFGFFPAIFTTLI